MHYLGIAFTLALLGVNLWGVTLVAGFYWRNRWFALVLGPLLFVTTFFGVECLHGLGRSLKGIELLGTALSVGLIALSGSEWKPARMGERWTARLKGWRVEFAPRRLAAPFGLFALLFGYAFLWRFCYPDIDGSSEKIADLSYICSYLTGSTIPVPDAWLYPFPSTQYYSFQFYGAALMGRLLGLSPGATYNIAYSLLVGLVGSAFSGSVILMTTKKWVRVLVISAFMIGGTGVTLLTHATEKDIVPWSNMRYIGTAKMDKEPVGTWIRHYQDTFFAHELTDLKEPNPHLDLPGEIFAYIVYLGDYHPPFSGYYLMGIGCMAVLLWDKEGRRGRYPAIAGGTLTWLLLANTWVLPLHVVALGAWTWVNRQAWRRLFTAFAAGAALVWMAAWPYLSAFTASATEYGVKMRLVPWGYHTPPLLFALFFLPTIALIALGFASGTVNGRRLGALWLFLLIFTEFFYAKDIYSGQNERFNTTLKWWPWVMAGTLLTLGPVVLEHARRKWVPIVGIIFCLYPCFYVFDLWIPLRDRLRYGDDAIGQLDGDRFLTRDENSRLMLTRLKLEKPGIVIERPAKEGGWVNSAVLPLLAGQRMWMGWYAHELLWHGYAKDIGKRHDLLMQFYGGNMPDAGKWLSAQGIDYVLWYRPEDTAAQWDKVNSAVKSEYIWCDVLTDGGPNGRRVGLWRRIPSP